MREKEKEREHRRQRDEDERNARLLETAEREKTKRSKAKLAYQIESQRLTTFSNAFARLDLNNLGEESFATALRAIQGSDNRNDGGARRIDYHQSDERLNDQNDEDH